jgi:hypothetical protein
VAIVREFGQMVIVCGYFEHQRPGCCIGHALSEGMGLFHEVYGQTEMGVNVCNHHGLGHTMATGSVGLPSPGFAFAVLDNELRPVPPGTKGVLAVDLDRSLYGKLASPRSSNR